MVSMAMHTVQHLPLFPLPPLVDSFQKRLPSEKNGPWIHFMALLNTAISADFVYASVPPVGSKRKQQMVLAKRITLQRALPTV
jgi:hypothetical protein